MLIQNIDSTSTLIEAKNVCVCNLYEALSMNIGSVYRSCLTWIAVVDALLGTGLL
jgi:hypothetical protein